MATFLDGAAAMACLAIGIFFVRFWRESEDRLFLWLGIGFAIFAMNYAVLGLVPIADERQAYAFVLRLAGFFAVLVGILVKDRELSEHLTRTGRPRF
jgi:hypothetical protein